MTRLIIAAAVLAAFLAFHPADTPTASAQAPEVCLNLPAGEHQFKAASRERAGEIVFRIEVGEGGRVTEFYEPGGQPIGVAGFLQVFTGAEAYPLPEGVEIVDCGASAEGDSGDDAGGITYCTGLEPGDLHGDGQRRRPQLRRHHQHRRGRTADRRDRARSDLRRAGRDRIARGVRRRAARAASRSGRARRPRPGSRRAAAADCSAKAAPRRSDTSPWRSPHWRSAARPSPPAGGLAPATSSTMLRLGAPCRGAPSPAHPSRGTIPGHANTGVHATMNAYTSDQLRNVVLMGHSGAGKTVLGEAMLLASGAINRLGRVEDGNTVSDYDPEEHAPHLLHLALHAPVEWNRHAPQHDRHARLRRLHRRGRQRRSPPPTPRSSPSTPRAASRPAPSWPGSHGRGATRSCPLHRRHPHGPRARRLRRSVLGALRDRFGVKRGPAHDPDRRRRLLRGRRATSPAAQARMGADATRRRDAPDDLADDHRGGARAADRVDRRDRRRAARALPRGRGAAAAIRVAEVLAAAVAAGDVVPVLRGVQRSAGVGVRTLMNEVVRLLPSPLGPRARAGRRLAVPRTRTGRWWSRTSSRPRRTPSSAA